jgi:hypothetical protein
VTVEEAQSALAAAQDELGDAQERAYALQNADPDKNTDTEVPGALAAVQRLRRKVQARREELDAAVGEVRLAQLRTLRAEGEALAKDGPSQAIAARREVIKWQGQVAAGIAAWDGQVARLAARARELQAEPPSPAGPQDTSAGVALAAGGGVQFGELVVRPIESADDLAGAVERRPRPAGMPNYHLVYDPHSQNVCPWSRGMASRVDSGELWLLDDAAAAGYWATGLFIPPDDLGEKLARQVTEAKRARDAEQRKAKMRFSEQYPGVAVVQDSPADVKEPA